MAAGTLVLIVVLSGSSGAHGVLDPGLPSLTAGDRQEAPPPPPTETERVWQIEREHPWRPWEAAGFEVEFLVGPALWDELPDQRPTIAFPTSSGFGSVDAWGAGFDLGVRGRLVDSDWADLWVGGELGVAGFDERRRFNVVLPDGEVVDDPVSADLFHLSATALLDVPVGPVTLFAGGGVGLYEVSFEEEFHDWWGRSEVIDDETALGGSVEFGFDWPFADHWALRVQDEIHFVRFDHLSGFSPGNSTLSGPVHQFGIGVAVRF